MATDVIGFLNDFSTSKFPWISRELSVKFAQQLRYKGATTIEMTNYQNILNAMLVLEMFVITDDSHKRAVLNELFKANPSELVETKKNVFRVAWDPVSLI